MAAVGRPTRGRERRTEYVPMNHRSAKITEGWGRTGRREEPSPELVAPIAIGAQPLIRIRVDATRASLYKIAKRMAVKGRSTMTRRQLLAAITAAGATARRHHR